MKVIRQTGFDKIFPYIAYIPETLSDNPALIIQLHGAGERGKNFEHVYAGAIAAVNEGAIWNCYVINSTVSVEESSELLNKHLYAYVYKSKN